MALYLDSASVEDARRAAGLGYVAGITTNPALVAATGRPGLDVLAELCETHPGAIFYQPIADSPEEREAEVRSAAAIRPARVVPKLPSTAENFALAARLVGDGIPVAMTAIFSPAQAFLACQVGARSILPYVNRSSRLLGDGNALVRSMRDVINASAGSVEIIAASLKSPDEAMAALLAGAHSLTLPLALIAELGRDELSEQAIAEFRRAANEPRARER